MGYPEIRDFLVNSIAADVMATVALRDAGAIPNQRVIPNPAATLGERPTTVLLADPEKAIVNYLRPALIEYAGCQIVEAGSLSAVNEIVDTGLVGDLAMVSIRFRDNTAPVIRALRRAGWPRVIALTPPAVDLAPVIAAVAAGASGVLSLPGVEPTAPGDVLPVHALTARELQVIRLVAQGYSNKQIGDRMELSTLTVKSHMARIAKKVGVGDRAHIVALACRGGLIGEPLPGPPK